MEHKIKILYIDDELLNLQAFKATFRRQFDIHTARSADEGLEILKNEPIEVVLADQRMPGKTGVDFFESIIDLHPNPIRILLTAFTDIKAIIDAINKGQVYRYVTKPWSEFDLKLTIENAYQLYLLKEQNNKLNLKYKEIFSTSTDPIILFDAQGRIIDYNKATLQLIEDKEQALNLTDFTSLIYNKNDSNNIINQFKTNKTIDGYECQIITKKGNLKTCLISGNLIADNYGNTISYQAIIKDITEQTKTNQLLFKKSVETQENERERISRDLHDGVGQTLIALKFKLEQLKNSIPQKEIYQITELSENLTDSINQLRNICYDILPPALAEYGLKYAITQLTTNIGEIKPIITISKDIPPIEKPLETALYRIIQEFINNAVKHANCSEIQINLSISNGLHLSLKDNGKGFNINTANYGLGISNIIARVKAFNGTHSLTSKKNNGTHLSIKIPLFTNNNTIYNPNNKDGFIKKIDTTTFSIGLHKDGLLIIKPKETFKDTTELKHAKENIAALKSIIEPKKVPFISYIPEYYINNEAVDYYNAQPTLSKATAFVYTSLTQKKIAEFLLKNTDKGVPMSIFNNEDEALEWAKKYINK